MKTKFFSVLLVIIFTVLAGYTNTSCVSQKLNRYGANGYNNPNTAGKLCQVRKKMNGGSAAYFNCSKLGQQKRGNAIAYRKKMVIKKKNNGKFTVSVKKVRIS